MKVINNKLLSKFTLLKLFCQPASLTKNITAEMVKNMEQENNLIKTENRTRYIYIDVLNVCACFCVVILHCTLTAFSYSHRAAWFESLLLQTLAHWAVPVFFMLSGATLLNYTEKYSTKIFFKKRLLRVFIPFILWSCIYIILDIIKGTLSVRNFYDIIDIILNNKAQDIFWFFYALFAVYLSIPILSLIIKKENVRIILYFFSFCLLNSSILPLVDRTLHLRIYNLLYFPLANGYVGYVILGWLLHNIELKKIYRFIIYLGGVIGIFIMFFGTYFLSARSGKFDTFFMDYQSLDCYLISAAVYVFVKYLRWDLIHNRIKIILRKLSEASFGVYLLQMIVINFVAGVFSVNGDSLLYMTLGASLIYIFCVSLVTIIKKIPIAKKIFP